MPPARINFESLLHRCHPQVYRIALALCVRRSDAENVVENVLTRSGTLSRKWETDAEAVRWFVHYTVLKTRDCPAAELKDDGLWNAATTAESAAVIAAIRQLPMQQREAFLLRHGEKLENRQLATAMDCSVAAAANHLAMATATLNKLTSQGLDDFTEELPALMRQLIPPDEILEIQIQQMMARRKNWIWTRRILRVFGWMILAVIIICVAWIAGRIIHGSQIAPGE